MYVSFLPMAAKNRKRKKERKKESEARCDALSRVFKQLLAEM